MRVSIIIPCYNERDTIAQVINRVYAAGIENMEVIVVDDGSDDGTRQQLMRSLRGYPYELIVHEKNRGKGAAVRSGIDHASGDVIIIQDADLEYDPQDYSRLLDPIYNDKADVVYGSRFLSGAYAGQFHYRLFNRLSTWILKRLSGLPVTDVLTGYKVLRAPVARALDLREPRFGVDVEITVKVVNSTAVRFHEVAIGYRPRRRNEGKKPGILDAVRTMQVVALWWWRSRLVA